VDARGVWAVEALARYQQPVVTQLAGDPAVEAVASVWQAPLLGASDLAVTPSGSRETVAVHYNFVSEAYFRVFRIPVRQGRAFMAEESAGDAAVALVSESTARRFWPGREAVGQSIAIPPPPVRAGVYKWLPPFRTARVVGVVGDVMDGYGRNTAQCVYFPGHPGVNGSVVVRMRGETADAQRRLEASLDRIAPSLADAIISMDDAVALRIFPFQVAACIAAFLAAVALLLTVTGIYGVMSYVVSQRTKEIGIRVALGASAGDVVRMVVRQSGRLAGIGAAVGAGLALAVAPVFAHQLEAIRPYDWVPYGVTAAIVVAAALAASYGPARKAVGVDPMKTLRCD
jgi:hypothetical protein